ncbi:MAG TPA: hypothetical protein PKV40_02515 [Candidatus Kapabacteria bacterium]|nr:hypothetical protein [Candidatus Kapabacteria bacterium]
MKRERKHKGKRARNRVYYISNIERGANEFYEGYGESGEWRTLGNGCSNEQWKEQGNKQNNVDNKVINSDNSK